MSFEAKTEQYAGPLDLMLHLISEHKLDIFDLDIDVLCTQYLAYLERLKEHRLERESEYLVELATLIELKSKRLLPKKQEEEEEEDPKDVLVRRLLEYQRYKEAGEKLQEAFRLRQESFSKPPQDSEDFGEEKERMEGRVSDLFRAMTRVMRRLQLSRPVETHWTRREISLEDCELRLKARLLSLPKTFSLEELLADVKDSYELVLSILAVLDLAKTNLFMFETDEQERIWFRKGV